MWEPHDGRIQPPPAKEYTVHSEQNEAKHPVTTTPLDQEAMRTAALRIPRQSAYHFSDTTTMWESDDLEETHFVRGYD